MATRAHTYLDWVFWLAMIIVVLIGGTGLYFSSIWQSQTRAALRDDAIEDVVAVLPDVTHAEMQTVRAGLEKWENRMREETVGPVFVRDGSIALLLAVFLTVTIELYAGRKLRDQVAEDVLTGVFHKIIPPKIFDEIRSQVIQSSVFRENWEVRMTLSLDQHLQQTDPNLYLSTTILEYDIKNLLNRSNIYVISVGLSLDVTGTNQQGEQLPRISAVTVDNTRFEGDSLKKYVKASGARFSMPVTLSASAEDDCHVLIEIEEVIRTPDAFYWATPMAADGATINIDTAGAPDLEFSVIAYHPNQDGLDERIVGERWVFSDGLLPWQGFEVNVKKKQKVTRADTTTS